MASTVKNNVVYEADVSNLMRGLERIEKQTKEVQNTFAGLKSAIAGIAIGSFIKNAIDAGVAIKSLSDSTGIAMRNIQGFSQAVMVSGGSAQQAQDSILKFVDVIGDAALGSKSAQEAFRDVGISLEDLGTLSEQDLLRKTIDGLSKITDPATRSSRALELLGRGVKGVDLSNVNSSIDAFTSKAKDISREAAAAQKAQDDLAIVMDKLANATLRALGPLLEFFNRLQPEKLDEVIEATVKLAAGMTALAGAVKVLSWLGTAFTILSAATASYLIVAKGGLSGLAKTIDSVAIRWKGFTTAFASSSTIFGKLSTVVTTLYIHLTKTLPYAIVNLLKLIPIVGGLVAKFEALSVAILATTAKIAALIGIIIGLNELIKKAFDVDPIDVMARKLEQLTTKHFPRLAAAINWIGEKLGMPGINQSGGIFLSEAEANDEITRIKKLADTRNAVSQNQRTVNDAEQRDREEAAKKAAQEYAKELKAVNDLVNAYKIKVVQSQNSFRIETQSIGLTERQRQINELMYSAESDFLTEIAQLQETYAELKIRAAEGDANAIKLMPQVAQAMDQLSQAYTSQVSAVQGLVDARQKQIAADNLRQYQISEQISLEQELQRIQDQTAKLYMSEIEAKYYDIERAAERSAEAAIRAEEARRGEKLDANEVKKYYDTARRGVEQLKRATGQHEAQARSWSVGWGKALREYVDNATNASKRAAEIFGKMTSGIEDLLVDFIKTGKFAWREFVADMLETLLRSQIKQVMASVFSPGGLLGGIGDLFGGLFGGDEGQARGNSANNPLYVMDVSGGGGSMGSVLGQMGTVVNKPGGSTGGGIWDTVKSVGSSIGGAVSGAWDTVKSIGSSIGGAVSNAVSWVGSLFDGFFANGGRIGSGKFGIVGERGPELITGPANVTPMSAVGGGTTNVYYTINAVDTQSFQQALARDPSLIYALTEKGRMSVAGGRR